MHSRYFNKGRGFLASHIIEGARNEYYLPGRPAMVARVVEVFAKKALFGGWDVYEVRHVHGAVAYGHTRDILGNMVPVTVDPRGGVTRKINDVKLTMAEAFNQVRQHEEKPNILTVSPSSGGEDIVLRQVKPKGNPRYWRNLEPPQGA